MGERHDGGGRTARRPVRPGPETRAADALRAALQPGRLDPEAESRALAAFREARKQWQDARPARTRRRDDWRPRARRHVGRSLRTLLAALLSGVTLGGVAVAAMGELPHVTAPPPARSEAPASPGVPERTSGTGTAGETAGTGGRSGAGAPRDASPSPDASARKAADKAAKGRRKADRKAAEAAAKAANEAGKSADKATKEAGKSADKAAKEAGKSAGKAAKEAAKSTKLPKPAEKPKPAPSPKSEKSAAHPAKAPKPERTVANPAKAPKPEKTVANPAHGNHG
ncbi:hypothetical protein ACWD5Q_07160 [Streptomyces sp. NPDC002513]